MAQYINLDAMTQQSPAVLNMDSVIQIGDIPAIEGMSLLVN